MDSVSVGSASADGMGSAVCSGSVGGLWTAAAADGDAVMVVGAGIVEGGRRARRGGRAGVVR